MTAHVIATTHSRFDLANAMGILERTPAAFRALLAGLPDAWTTPNEGPNTFSAFDNLGHLVHGERTDWIPRARIILEHGRSRPFDPYDRFAQVHESRGKSVHDLLDELAERRAQNLETLRGWKLTDRELRSRVSTPRSDGSRWRSCWRRGWCTTSDTWPRRRA